MKNSKSKEINQRKENVISITLKRQINDNEKKRILERHGRICYATGHHIPENDTVNFDHIKAFCEGGPSTIENIAPMCEMHNKQKGRMTLYEFRASLEIKEFFSTGDTLTLKHQLHFLKQKKRIENFGNPAPLANKFSDKIEIEIENKNTSFALFKCPVTGWKYFFASLPVEVLDSDDDEDHEIGLQPRYLIFDKVFNLFRHFQRHPVLQPCICRLHKNRILVFDGQHKMSSLLWLGFKQFECKVYITADPKLLNETNISAHDKFAQTRFYQSIMVDKLGRQFGKEFEEYKNLEDGNSKTESGFISYLQNRDSLEKPEVNKRFKSFLWNSVLDEKSNKASKLISKSNRGSSEQPLTMDMISKSIFSCFLYNSPTDDDLASVQYLREDEINNVIFLFNKLYTWSLVDWDGTKPKSDLKQMKLNRLFSSKSIMAWAGIMRDAVIAKLDLIDAEERAMPFYRVLSDKQRDDIELIILRLIEWPIWDSPKDSEIDLMISNNATVVKKYLKDKGLTTGFLMGAPE